MSNRKIIIVLSRAELESLVKDNHVPYQMQRDREPMECLRIDIQWGLKDTLEELSFTFEEGVECTDE